jgi:hypothetical protein
MPKYVVQDEEMDGYAEEPAVAPPVEAPAAADESQTVDEQNAGESEILVSKKDLPAGMKEGDTCVMTMKKDFGDECSMTCQPEGEEEAGETTNDEMNAATEKDFSNMAMEGA